MLGSMQELIIYTLIFIFMLIFVFVFILFTFTLILQSVLIFISVFIYIYILSEVQPKSFGVEKYMPQIKSFGQVCTYLKPS